MRSHMKQPLTSLSLLLVVGASACGDAAATGADDFARDLQLASSTVNLASVGVDSTLLGTLETRPSAEPKPSTTLKKASGNRAVRSRTPTVRATPSVDVAEGEESEVVETIAEAPAPVETHEPVAVAPRPAPPVIVATGDAAGDYGTSGSGGGIFGGGGGGGGVVIRGGGVDGDNCELHRTGRRGGTSRGPIYVPVPIARTPMPTPSRPSTPTVTRGGSRGTTIGFGGARRVGSGREVSQPSSPGPRTATAPRSSPRSRGPRIGG